MLRLGSHTNPKQSANPPVPQSAMSGFGDRLAELKESLWLEARKAGFKSSFRQTLTCSVALGKPLNLSLHFFISELGMHYISYRGGWEN